ncbi:MauE/DoxX family redox-associated membrane protein [Streptomyces sp. NPDC093149]|uniref:MauE/DoxX family redox-associated membrane protein n=1 Tax=Streptomyces sp. NPDC093149 TaxID=3366031 RepID=UPI00381AA512
MHHSVNYVVDGGRVLLGLVFLCSALSKSHGAAAFRDFRDAVGRLAPDLRRHSAPVAVTVVTAEAAVVVMLAVPAAVAAGFALAAVLLLAFTVGLVAALRRGVSTACHCFGAGDERLAPRHVVRNLALVTVAIAGTAAALNTPHIDSAPSARLLLTTGVAAVLALITVTLDDLANLFGVTNTGVDAAPKVTR